MELKHGMIREWGIVGAGGAGFPTYLKLQCQVDTLILNAVECEPLLHKDKEILRHYSPQIVRTLKDIADMVRASRIVIAIKKKNMQHRAALKSLPDRNVELFLLDDFYPAGDEIILVNLVTDRLVPPGKIPPDVHVLVLNVETVYNISRHSPVTHTFLTVGGDVPKPVTVQAPIGALIGDILTTLAYDSDQDKAMLVGGVMMGNLGSSREQPVTMTTAGLILLPLDHPLVRKYQRKSTTVTLIGSSCCDQCSMCTDLCPRFLVGHPVQPHLAMRALSMKNWEHELSKGCHYCSECNLCSLASCPLDLDPKEICHDYKTHHSSDIMHLDDLPLTQKKPYADERRFPLSRLMTKLGLNQYDQPAPLIQQPMTVTRVSIPLKQHGQHLAQPLVETGDQVRTGDKIADLNPPGPGVPIHSSINGFVRSVTPTHIEIRTTP